jgi:hypothetical protein
MTKEPKIKRCKRCDGEFISKYKQLCGFCRVAPRSSVTADMPDRLQLIKQIAKKIKGE